MTETTKGARDREVVAGEVVKKEKSGLLVLNLAELKGQRKHRKNSMLS